MKTADRLGLLRRLPVTRLIRDGGNRGRLFRLGWRVSAGLGVAFVLASGLVSARYGVPFRTAAKGLVRGAALQAIRGSVAVFDPCEVKRARTGPADGGPGTDFGPRLETMLAPGTALAAPGGKRLSARALSNAAVVRGRFRFGYQTSDEPGLRRIREAYDLDRVVAPAWGEFEAMVRVRGWARSQFRRNQFHRMMTNFDACELLRPESHQNLQGGYYDPCHLFPALYVQLLASLGHQARVCSMGHGFAEVWSNEYAKWVLMDAELDHHFVRDGVPLNAAELLDANFGGGAGVRLVRGMRYPLPENPTMPQLGLERLTAEICIPWFKAPLEMADLRNDWLTNHYFAGHPQRSESNSFVYVDPRIKVDGPLAFRLRARYWTDVRSDMYWTLNQAEMRFGSWDGETLVLGFDTVTPNFRHFEVVVDGADAVGHESSVFRWRLHAGENSLVVRPVNEFGITGVESTVELTLSPGAGPAAAVASGTADGGVGAGRAGRAGAGS